MKKVILIYGLPATGKLTIAELLKKEIIKSGKDAYLFDNHYFNNIVYPYLDITPNLNNICKGVYKIRDIFFELVGKFNNFKDNSVIIFTNVLLDNKDDRKAVKQLKLFAQKINADFLPVYLHCDYIDMIKRCSNPERIKRNKIADKELMDWFVNEHDFLTIKDSLSIDTSENTPKKVVNTIIKKIT